MIGVTLANTSRYNHGINISPYKKDGISFALNSSGDQGVGDSHRIRRLTPTECERLQGFPDGWTSKGLTLDGKETIISDTQRYKMCGNAVTVNVIRFLGRRIQNIGVK